MRQRLKGGGTGESIVMGNLHIVRRPALWAQ